MINYNTDQHQNAGSDPVSINSASFPARKLQDVTVQNALDILKSLCGRSNEERFDICSQLLQTLSKNVQIVDFGDGKNLICTFSDNPTYKKIFGAHFDIVPGSPGANDNGAAVAELVSLAAELYGANYSSDDLAIVLFDNEEVMFNHPEKSGSREFADFLAAKGVKPDLILVLDVCGSGNIAGISSTAPAPALLKQSLREDLDRMYIPSVEIWTPHSDSTMFGRAGLDALLLSTLSDESLKELLTTPDTTHWNQQNKYPKEWMKLHSPGDDFNSIDPETVEMMIKILRHLAKK